MPIVCPRLPVPRRDQAGTLKSPWPGVSIGRNGMVAFDPQLVDKFTRWAEARRSHHAARAAVAAQRGQTHFPPPEDIMGDYLESLARQDMPAHDQVRLDAFDQWRWGQAVLHPDDIRYIHVFGLFRVRPDLCEAQYAELWDEYEKWLRTPISPTAGHVGSANPRLDMIKDAIRNGLSVRIHYDGKDGESDHVTRPFSLAGGTLRGVAADGHTIEAFMLHRIVTLVLLDA